MSAQTYDKLIVNDPSEGETRGVFVADSETYGATHLWCLLQAIPIDLDDESDTPLDDA